MNPYDPSKRLTFYTEACQVLAGGLCAPRTALVYPCRACNQHCYFCSDAQTNRELRGRLMERSLLFSLPQQLAELRCEAIELCGGGEPFLHPDIAAFIERSTAAGFKLGALTNGTLLQGKLADLVLASFSFIRISLDSFNPQTYQRVRGAEAQGPNSLEQVRRNVEYLVRRKNQTRSPCLITLKAVFSRDTLAEVPDYIQCARELEVDGINIKAVRNVVGQLDAADDVSVLDHFKRQNRPGRPFVFGSLQRARLAAPQCFACCFHIFVDTDGSLRLCCYYQNRPQTHTYAKLTPAQPLRELWYSEAHRKAVTQINPDECSLYDCKYFGYNNDLWKGIIQDAGQWQFT